MNLPAFFLTVRITVGVIDLWLSDIVFFIQFCGFPARNRVTHRVVPAGEVHAITGKGAQNAEIGSDDDNSWDAEANAEVVRTWIAKVLANTSVCIRHAIKDLQKSSS